MFSSKFGFIKRFFQSCYLSSFCCNSVSLCLQMELITQQAMRAGFTGGVVIDYPNSTRAKKLNNSPFQSLCAHSVNVVFPYRIFLCLFTGGTPTSLPKVDMRLYIPVTNLAPGNKECINVPSIRRTDNSRSMYTYSLGPTTCLCLIISEAATKQNLYPIPNLTFSLGFGSHT